MDTANMTFEELYKSIEAYQEDMGYDYETMTQEQRMESARNYTTALVVELGELLTEVPWKPWRPIKSQSNNKRKALLEFVDCLFFLVDIGLSLDFTANEILDAFTTKLKANRLRISNGYSKIKTD